MKYTNRLLNCLCMYVNRWQRESNDERQTQLPFCSSTINIQPSSVIPESKAQKQKVLLLHNSSGDRHNVYCPEATASSASPTYCDWHVF